MAGAATIERLRQFLKELSPQTRSLLIVEFERSLLRGSDNAAAAELVLRQLRRIVREQHEKTPRASDTARLFFRPLEPYLVDDAGANHHPGRIARSSLESIWNWIGRDLLPEEVKTLDREVVEALGAGEETRAMELVYEFQDRVAAAVEARIIAGRSDEKTQRRLLAQIGTPNAQGDSAILHGVLKGRVHLAALAEQLPLQIGDLKAQWLDNCKALIDRTVAQDRDLFVYALLTVMSRLSAPWQLIRFGTKAAGSDTAARVAETQYGVAVTIVLDELERLVGELRNDLRSGRGVAVAALLKSIHDCVRGVRTELALSIDSDWGRTLAAQRAQIADLLRLEIDTIPGRVRRLLRARAPGDIRPHSVLDADEVAETAALVEFACVCRYFAGELAINEITQRAFTELQQYLDSSVRSLLESLRQATPTERPFRRSQFEAARRFCAPVFGPGYAHALAKAAEAAHAAEPRAARA
jgi:hypothetical protein